MAIINGRRIDPNSINNGVNGSELIRHSKTSAGRRPIIERGGKVEQIDPQHNYRRDELVDKHGRGAKISSMPDRSKGQGFSGQRSRQSKAIITEQVIDIAEHQFKQGVRFDEDDANWLVIENYPLPPNWRNIANTTALLVQFPVEYPALPPIGFYLPDNLPAAHDSHFISFAAHGASNAPIQEGWNWYCVYIHNGAWQPTQNWRDGDNLWTYFLLIREALGTKE